MGGDPDGQPILLWHGFLGTGYAWRRVMPALAEVGLSVLISDMRVYGDSDKPAGTEATPPARSAKSSVRLRLEISNWDSRIADGPVNHWYGQKVGSDTYHLYTLPSTPQRLRVGLDWVLDALLPRLPVQFGLIPEDEAPLAVAEDTDIYVGRTDEKSSESTSGAGARDTGNSLSSNSGQGERCLVHRSSAWTGDKNEPSLS